MSIVLVGSGPSVLETEHGREIDSFSTVCRFNAFKTEGYEKHTGTKTDIWFINSTRDAKEYAQSVAHKELAPRLVYVTAKSDKKRGMNLNHLRKSYANTKVQVEEFDISWLQKYIWEVKKFKVQPSTGLIAIMWFVAQGKHPITIHGFDILMGKDCPNQHYYDTNCHISGHKPVLEARELQTYLDGGFVNLLS
jgi:hypothetical protein